MSRSSAHARSGKAQAKKARRNKRQAKRDANWIPDAALDDIVDGVDLVEDLESFDGQITRRGWVFDEEESDDEILIWFYPPSGSKVAEGLAPVTGISLHADEDADVVHVVLVGTADDRPTPYQEFFERLDSIEDYRCGESTTP
jgi:hypothetical protein